MVISDDSKRKKGIAWLEFERLQGLKHGIFLRHGGSSELFQSLNMSYRYGDNRDAVMSNWQAVMGL